MAHSELQCRQPGLAGLARLKSGRGLKAAPRLAIVLFTAVVCSAQIADFDDTAPDRIVLRSDTYELSLSKTNGAIVGLVQTSTGAKLTAGSRNGCLWGVNLNYPGPQSQYFGGCSPNRFSYVWDGSTLALTYAGRINVTVTIAPGDGPFFDMRLSMENIAAVNVGQVLFPSDLLFSAADVRYAYLPFQLPGVRLRPSFFLAHRSTTDVYPGIRRFADYVALDLSGGSIAVYTVDPDGPVQPVTSGFVDDNAQNPGRFYSVHTYQTDVPPGAGYISPTVRIRVGETARDTILAYRRDNGIDAYPSLADKLGPRFDQVVRAPLIKTAWRSYINKTFREAIADLDRVSAPAILHPVEFQPGGFDQNVPDFLPPDPRFGSTADFAAWSQAARDRGLFVMPYTNPTWWNPGSPTLSGLPAGMPLEQVTVLDLNRKPVYETYGPNGGYAVCPWAPFVQERLAALMAQWSDEAPVDFVFFDQIGARPWLRDFNAAAPDRLSYSEGWLTFWRRYAAQGLMTEDGWDRLAADGIGFCGSPLTGTTRFDLATERYGIGGNGHRLLGAGNWDPYPLATWLLHDKVLFYHHDLEALLTTEQPEVVTWNLAFGNMMTFMWPLSRAATPAGVELANRLQRSVASQYAGRALDDFVYLTPDVTRSTWGELQIIANWSQTEPYEIDGRQIAPGGHYARLADGTVLAPAFNGPGRPR